MNDKHGKHKIFLVYWNNCDMIQHIQPQDIGMNNQLFQKLNACVYIKILYDVSNVLL